jgi:hypothetical protein
MSFTGVSPVSLLLLLSLLCKEGTEEAKTLGRMPMGLMAKMAMPQRRGWTGKVGGSVQDVLA